MRPERNEVSASQSSSRSGLATKPSSDIAKCKRNLPAAICGSVSDVAHVGCERRVDLLHRLEARIRDAVEEALAGAEQDGNEVEHELVDHACTQRLTHGGCAAGDVDSSVAGGFRGARERRVEAVGDEVKRRPT